MIDIKRTDLFDRAAQVAETIGTEHGRDAASWFELDDVDAARRILTGLEDGDPEILDALPTADLSGQWADGYSATDLYNEVSDALELGETDDDTYADLRDAACDAYEAAFNDAATAAVESAARAMLPDVVELGRSAGLTPFVWDNAQLRGSTWVETNPAVGGESVSCSAVRAPYADETPQYFEVPVATWGDYVGSAVERSNHRSLVRDYPGVFVEVSWGYGGNSLLLPVSSLETQEDPEELANLLTGLREQYPLYDESDHSELEMELAEEAWDAWARFDLLRDLRDAGLSDETIDAIDETELRDRFYTAVSESDHYPYAESADSIVFPMWDDVVAELAEHYGV